MSDTHMPPPLPSGAPTSVKGHATNMARNVTVSVLSTVIGASMIWLLGFNHGGSSGFLEIKDATVSAWKSYETYENSYTKNSESLLQDLVHGNIGFDEFLKQVHIESDKFLTSVGELTRKKDVDKDLIIALKRRIDNEKLSMPPLDDYINQLKNIVNGNMGADEKKTALNNANVKWVSVSDGKFQRAITDISEIAKTLSERYAQSFSMDDFLVIKLYNQNKKTADSLHNLNQNNVGNNPNNNNNSGNVVPNDPNSTTQNNNVNAPVNNTTMDGSTFVGEWDTNNTGLDLNKDGSMYWAPDSGSSVSGTWRFDNSQLYMYPKATTKIPNGTIWIFNLSNVTPNSFTMKLANQPNIIYYLIRSQGN